MSTANQPPLHPVNSDAVRLFRVIAIFVTIMLIFIIGALALIAEIIGQNRPGQVDIDPAEMKSAQTMLPKQAKLLAELQQEQTSIKQLLKAGFPTAPAASKTPQNGTPRRDQLVPHHKDTPGADPLTAGDDLSRRFFSLFSGANRIRLENITQMQPEQQRQLTKLTLSGLDVGYVRTSPAIQLVDEIGSRDDKIRALKIVISQLASDQSLKIDSAVATTLIRNCALLEEEERTKSLVDLIERVSPINDDIRNVFESVCESQAPQHRKTLARLVDHPDHELGQYASEALPTELGWQIMLPRLKSDNYVKFSGAAKWIGVQKVDESIRKQVLDAIRPVLWYHNASGADLLKTYCQWADKSEILNVTSLCSKPIKSKSDAANLAELVLRLQMPIDSILRSSSGALESEWYSLYAQRDEVLVQSVRRFLTEPPATPAATRWIQRIANQGDSHQRSDLEFVVKTLKESRPNSLLVGQAVRRLQELTHRLNSE